MFVLAAILISAAAFKFVKNRRTSENKLTKSEIVLDYLIPALTSLILIIVGSFQIMSTSLHRQVSKSVDVNYLDLSAIVHVKSGEDVRYKFDAASDEYSSTNNVLMQGLNEVLGRYDFEAIESIEEIATNQWEITFKCDCGKVKSIVVTD
jgi:hypothetical protein